MPTSTSNSLMPLARGTAGLTGLFGMCVGALGVFRPEVYTVAFGFHPQSLAAKLAPINPFVAIVGGRAVVTGLTIVLSVVVGDSDAATGLLLLTSIAVGVSDAVAVTRFAGIGVEGDDGRVSGREDPVQLNAERRAAKSAARGHIFTTALIAGLGWCMLAVGE